MVLFFTHIPFVVNHTFNATPPERLHQDHWQKRKKYNQYQKSLNFLKCFSKLFVNFSSIPLSTFQKFFKI